MTEKKSNNTKILIGVFALLIALVVAMVAVTPPPTPPAEAPATGEQADGTLTPPPVAAEANPVSINVAEALEERILGNTAAPMKISEHASLTCSHCAQFHNDTFDQVQKNYIDTGKAYLVFSDFPLNKPAMQASMIARCLPKDKFFPFVHMLFKTQPDWAYSPSYLEILKQKAVAEGMSEATFNACAENKELQAGIEERMKAVQDKWNVGATPTFIINNTTVISGALTYEDFSKALDSEAANKAQAPAESSPAPSPAEEKAVPGEDPIPPQE